VSGSGINPNFCVASCGGGRTCGSADGCNGFATAGTCYANGPIPGCQPQPSTCPQCQTWNAQGIACGVPANEGGSCNPGTGGTGTCHSGTCSGPTINNGGITDYQGGSIESGDIATIYGTGLDAGGPTVFFNGIAINSGPHFSYGVGCGGGCTQINFDVPTSLPGGVLSSIPVYVQNVNGRTNTQYVNVTSCSGSGYGPPPNIGCTSSYVVAGQTVFCRSMWQGSWQNYNWITQPATRSMCQTSSQVCTVGAQCQGSQFYCEHLCGGGVDYVATSSCDYNCH
jgi:hypothetical protein